MIQQLGKGETSSDSNEEPYSSQSRELLVWPQNFQGNWRTPSRIKGEWGWEKCTKWRIHRNDMMLEKKLNTNYSLPALLPSASLHTPPAATPTTSFYLDFLWKWKKRNKIFALLQEKFFSICIFYFLRMLRNENKVEFIYFLFFPTFS